MLRDEKMFSVVEEILKKNGTIDAFEKENGKIRGRMMIEKVAPPQNAEISGDSLYTFFEASFDFYDKGVIAAIDTRTLKIMPEYWVKTDEDDDDGADQDILRFFLKTLLDNIPGDGGYGTPMYTFVSENASFTVVPSRPEE